MGATRQLSIILPTELADLVQHCVASGAYASESEVVQEGLLTLEACNEALESRLRRDVLPTYKEMMDNPSQGVPMDLVFDRVEARLRARLKREG